MAARIDDDTLDRLLLALADATRRHLLERLREEPGTSLGGLAEGLAMTRQAVAKHLAVLEGVGLVVTLWAGREKRHYLDPRPLSALPVRWVMHSAREARNAGARIDRLLAAARRARR